MSVVRKKAVVTPATVEVGTDVQVRIRRTNYADKISAIGKFHTVE